MGAEPVALTLKAALPPTSTVRFAGWMVIATGTFTVKGAGVGTGQTADSVRYVYRTLSGEIHTSPTAFTTVGTYELADGSRWTRTLVMHVQRRRVTRLALYRRRLYM